MSKKKVTTTTTTTTTVVTKTETVNNKPTQIVMVLDRSGSMDSIAKATVEGINSFIKEQKAAEGTAYMTLVQFDKDKACVLGSGIGSRPIFNGPEI